MLLPHCTTLYAPHERMIAYMYILHTFHSMLTFIVHVIHVSVLREFDGGLLFTILANVVITESPFFGDFNGISEGC